MSPVQLDGAVSSFQFIPALIWRLFVCWLTTPEKTKLPPFLTCKGVEQSGHFVISPSDPLLTRHVDPFRVLNDVTTLMSLSFVRMVGGITSFYTLTIRLP